MYLAKAIEIVSEAAYGKSWTLGPDFYDSLKLLIEAGKRIREQRKYNLAFHDKPLPGETE